MSRIESTFADVRGKGEKGLIAYLTVGFPSLRIFSGLVETVAEAGADLIELGVPFSDPLADGPTIQAASQRALKQRVTTRRVFQEVSRLRRRGIDLPIALMTYANPVFQYGLKRFSEDCLHNGVDGVIIPDLPPEEAGEWIQAARPSEVDTIFLAAPTSDRSRLRKVARASTGFIYFVSLTGVTGARDSLSSSWVPRLRVLKQLTGLPVCVGFGISTPAQVKRVARFADGVIVGSALLNLMGSGGNGMLKKVKSFVQGLKRACRG